MSQCKTQLEFRVTIRNKAGDLAPDADLSEVRFWLKIGKGSRLEYLFTVSQNGNQVSRESEGVYLIRFTPVANQVGLWAWDWETEGNVIWSGGGSMRVTAQHTA